MGSPTGREYGFFGDYLSWTAARSASAGYEAKDILEKVRASALLVKSGAAAFERDGVAFEKPDIRWPLVASLLHVAVSNDNGCLSVLDFGGSLGSGYFQNRSPLEGVRRLRWAVIEQPHFVASGRAEFADDRLVFYSDLAEAVDTEKPHVVLLSSSLQYLESPYQTLEEILGFGVKFLLFDRLALNVIPRDRLTVQRVPPSIYPASYPAWFLSKERFLRTLSPDYRCVAEFEASDHADIPSEFKGFLFRRKGC